MTNFDYNNSIARELERHVEELITYSFNNLTDEQSRHIHTIAGKISELRRFFPDIELPKN